MLFNSYEFIFGFMPIVFLGLVPLVRWQPGAVVAWLLLASVAFYAWWDPRYMLLLGLSIAINFWLARGLITHVGTGAGRLLLLLGLVLNIGTLFFFKYFDFFVRTANSAAGADWPVLGIVLPLGISFFTFTQLAFLIDTSRGEVAEVRWQDYLLFVTYFPHLIAGPILHHKEMMPQFAAARRSPLSLVNLTPGLAMFVIGLGKKVLLADTFARYATPVFEAAAAGSSPRTIAAWVGAIAYTLQLYFDFSGYSDMAVGISKMMGIRIPANFSSPYKARNLVEFWRRWHMTLSRFLRDYLYIPLGGNRHGPLRRYLNLFATMLLGGLWHGANWTFVAWGAIHGAGLVVNHAWQATAKRLPWQAGLPGRIAAWSLTMLTVVTAWVVFRADSLASAGRILKGMIGGNGLSLPERLGPLDQAWGGFLARHGATFTENFIAANESLGRSSDLSHRVFFCYLLVGIVVLACPNSHQILARYSPAIDQKLPVHGSLKIDWFWGVSTALLFAACLLFMGRKSEFLYFQF